MTRSEQRQPGSRRAKRTAAGFAATSVLVGIVVAVPLGLLAAGAIPHGGFLVHAARQVHWPPWRTSSAVTTAGSAVSPAAFARACVGFVAALFAWLVWGWMLVCLGLDIRARWRGERAAQLPASRTLQAVAACLVGASFALVTSSRWHESAPARAQVRPAQQMVLSERLASVTRVVDNPQDVLLGAPFPASPEPERPGIPGGGSPYDRSPQAGSMVEPSDGATGSVPPSRGVDGRLSEVVAPPGEFGDGGACSPGDGGATLLRRHADPAGTAHRGEPAAPVTSGIGTADRSATYVVGARETLWSIAEEQLGSPRRWRELAAHNYGRVQADGGMLERDHFLRPGWTLWLPPPAQGQGQPGVEPREPVSEGLPGGDVRRSDRQRPDGCVPTEAVDGSGDGSREYRSPAAESAPTQRRPAERSPGIGPRDLLGIGFVGTIDRLRRAQLRHRPHRTTPRIPDPRWHSIERRFRASMDPWFASDVQRCLDRFGTAWGSRGVPEIASVLVSDAVVEIVLAGVVERTHLDAAAAALGASCAVDVSVGRLTMERQFRSGREEPRTNLSAGRIPCPALVTGRTDDASVLHLVSIEVGGPFCLEGSRAERSEALAFVALELSMSPWGRQLEVSLIGSDGPFPPALPVAMGVDPEEVIGAAHLRRLQRRRLMDTHGWMTLHDARRASTEPVWNTAVVLCGPAVPTDVETELGELAQDQLAGLAMVTVGAAAGNRQLQLALPQAALSLPVRGHGAREAIDGLINGAAELSPADSIDGSGLAVPPPRRSAPPEAKVRPPVEGLGEAPSPLADTVGPCIEVRVLGPVEIAGSTRPFSRAWARELVVYLAMHPNGAANDLWSTALWPDRLLASSSLHSTASVARRTLGVDPDGSDHLPRAHGRLQLGPYVTTDWVRFDDLAERDDPSNWRAALDLVRGRPFDGLKATDWLVLEGIGPAVEARVVDTATDYAEWCLDTGNPSGAEWAARRGLLASPYDERLYRVLLRAADAAGNPAGVEAAMAELVRLVADDVEPFDAVHPETLDLYRSLSRRRSFAAR